ncbi:MAG: formyl transferase [Clostridia bacterium]|nr:formyl transferase [Clostridia bacterium]
MKIVMLCSKGTSSAIVYNELIKHFNIEMVIAEEDVKKSVFLRRRIRKLGLFTVFGQVLFSVIFVPFLRKTSRKRVSKILNEYDTDMTPNYMKHDKLLLVDSVNSNECIRALQEIQPDIIVVNGTRIISSKVLNCVNGIFINMHAGITPKYRGVHGAYWALYNNDIDNMGVTIHLVDEGIDTGNILYQDRIKITSDDNFTTYPIIQTSVGVKSEVKAINDIINGSLKTMTNDLTSHLYSHPTVFQYIYKRITKGVK